MSDLLRLAFDDGTTGYAYSDADMRNAAAGSYAESVTPVNADIEWTVDDLDDDDLAEDMISIDPGTLAELLRLARIGSQYAGCSTCRRVTLV